MTITNYFEKQPDENIFDIFLFLDSESLQNCSGVDRRFNAIAKDLQLWKKLFPNAKSIEKARESFLKRIKSERQFLKLVRNTFEDAPYKKSIQITIHLTPNSFIKIMYCLGHNSAMISQLRPHQTIERVVDKQNPFLDLKPKNYIFHSSDIRYYDLGSILKNILPIGIVIHENLDETVIAQMNSIRPKIIKICDLITEDKERKIIEIFSLTVIPIIAIAARYFV